MSSRDMIRDTNVMKGNNPTDQTEKSRLRHFQTKLKTSKLNIRSELVLCLLLNNINSELKCSALIKLASKVAMTHRS